MSGFYWRLGEQMDVSVNRRIHAVVRAMVARPLPGVTDLVPGYACLYVEFDARITNEPAIRAFLAKHEIDQDEAPQPARLDIPVRYDGEDLAEMAARADLSAREVIELYSSRQYHVHALGFSPGLPFMGEVDEKLRFPRRPNPRPRVPAHTVAVANAQTNIYPIASPGGWNLLGRALIAVYDPHRDRPFYIEPGDQVRFVPSEGATPPEPEPLRLLLSEPQKPVLRVLEPGLQDLVVDQGRLLVGRYGLCRSGALDARSAGIANALLGNPPQAPLIEMNFKGPVLEVLSDTVLAFAGWGVIPARGKEPLPTFCSLAVKRGDVLTFKPSREGARGYLAVGGGVESRVFMESASVDLRGKIGQPLRGGEVLGKVSARREQASALTHTGLHPS
jgi:KipI family sensor histidine kinase inhibitor